MDDKNSDKSRHMVLSGMAGGLLASNESSYATGQMYGATGGHGGP